MKILPIARAVTATPATSRFFHPLLPIHDSCCWACLSCGSSRFILLHSPDKTITPQGLFTCRRSKKHATDLQECHGAPGVLRLYIGRCFLERYTECPAHACVRSP